MLGSQELDLLRQLVFNTEKVAERFPHTRASYYATQAFGHLYDNFDRDGTICEKVVSCLIEANIEMQRG